MGFLQKKYYKISKGQKIFLGLYVISALAAILLMTFFLKRSYSVISDVGNFLNQAIYYPFNVVKNILAGQAEVDSLKKENYDLKKKLAELSSLREENNFLKKNLDLHDFKGRLIQARILFYPIDNKNQAYINLGKIHGISAGMPLVAGSSLLIGKVVDIQDQISRIVFVTDEEFISPAAIEGLNISAAASGNGDSITITTSINQESMKALKGQMVFTGSADPTIPPRLVLGKITSIEEDKKINVFRFSVQPMINKNEIFDVFVLKAQE